MTLNLSQRIQVLIPELRPPADSDEWDGIVLENTGSGDKISAGTSSKYTRPSDSDLAAVTQSQYDIATKKYQRDRATEYPSYGEQLDYIYHHGVAKWKTDIVQPVKDKFPKPS